MGGRGHVLGRELSLGPTRGPRTDLVNSHCEVGPDSHDLGTTMRGKT